MRGSLRVRGICRTLCVMVPIVLYSCRRNPRNYQQPSTNWAKNIFRCRNVGGGGWGGSGAQAYPRTPAYCETTTRVLLAIREGGQWQGVTVRMRMRVRMQRARGGGRGDTVHPKLGQKHFPVPKPFKEKVSRSRLRPPLSTPPLLRSNACLVRPRVGVARGPSRAWGGGPRTGRPPASTRAPSGRRPSQRWGPREVEARDASLCGAFPGGGADGGGHSVCVRARRALRATGLAAALLRDAGGRCAAAEQVRGTVRCARPPPHPIGGRGGHPLPRVPRPPRPTTWATTPHSYCLAPSYRSSPPPPPPPRPAPYGIEAVVA